MMLKKQTLNQKNQPTTKIVIYSSNRHANNRRLRGSGGEAIAEARLQCKKLLKPAN